MNVALSLWTAFLFGQGIPEGAIKVEFEKPLKIALASNPVEFHGNKLPIVSSSEVQLSFGRLGLRPKPELSKLVRAVQPLFVGSRWLDDPTRAETDPFPYEPYVEPTLKATLKAAVAQYNRVDYRIFGAVYDAKGKLLGTASAVEKVQYIRLGIMPTVFRDIELDFGASKAFAEAAYVAFAVSDPDVPKPPDG